MDDQPTAREIRAEEESLVLAEDEEAVAAREARS
jgi:hypothetical protein